MRESYEKPVMEIEEIDTDIIMQSMGPETCCDGRCDTVG